MDQATNRTFCELLSRRQGKTLRHERERVALLLRTYRYTLTDEESLQDGAAQVLADHGVIVEREYRLGPHDRIDFYVPATKLGIEVKSHGSPTAVLEQLFRYAQHDAVGALVLVTRRRALIPKARELAGKPLTSVYVALGGAF